MDCAFTPTVKYILSVEVAKSFSGLATYRKRQSKFLRGAVASSKQTLKDLTRGARINGPYRT